MPAPALSPDSAAALVARLLRARGVDRVFGLCGGHVMPLWMRCDAEGISIVDVRDERAAVHMAHAHAEMTGGLGVALVTAGPGVTNAITGIAHAHVARAPVLVLSGVPPRPQENRGALQDLVHTDLVRSVTRLARTVREPALVLQEVDEAVARAFGEGGGEPGPVYLDFPTDVLRAAVPRPLQLEEHLRAKPRTVLTPEPVRVTEAVDLLWSARRPLVVSGRGARGAGPELVRLLDALGAPYLDTGESRGLVPEEHPSVVAAMRGTVMRESDVVVTVGRRLDFQLAYGSPAIWGPARFVRISEVAAELRDNRRGAVEILATPVAALRAIVEHAGARAPAVDRDWVRALRAHHVERVARFRAGMASAPPGADGRMHPNRVLAAVQAQLAPDAVLIADGGDALSHARVGLTARTYLDPGSLGCLGVGVPFGIAAALAQPERQVVVVSGDGAFGFNAIELDTAARHHAGAMFVVLNNGAWQIEVDDQRAGYGRVVGTRLQFSDYAAVARGLGVTARRVENAADLPSAVSWALAHRPSLLDVVVTPEAPSPDSRSELAWVPELQPLAAWDDLERSWRAS